MRWEVRTMRSGTSHFDLTLCKKNASRFWPLWAGYLLIWLFALPLRALTTLQYRARELREFDYDPLLDFARSVARDMRELTLILAVGFGVVVAMATFSHLYSARSANFVGSLPITRDGVFVTCYLTGLGFLLIPNLIVFLLTLLIEGVAGCVVMAPLLAWLAMSCAMGFFFYSFAVLMGQITGHLLALPVFYGIFNGLAAGLFALLYWVVETFYYGFTSMGDGLEQFVLWLTPVYRLSEVNPRWIYDEAGFLESFELRDGWYLAVYAAAALLLVAPAWWAHRTRRLESAGDVVAISWIRPVFKYSVAFCAGLAFGLLTQQILQLDVPGLVVSVTLWAVAGCFVAQMFLDKSFRVLSKWRGPAAMAAVMLGLCAVVALDLTGFESRVPDPASVAEVEIGSLTSYPSDGGSWSTVVSEDPAVIAAAVSLHRAVVDQWERSGGEYRDWSSSTSYRVTYTLRGGATISRYYRSVRLYQPDLTVPGTVTGELSRLLATDGYRRACYGLDDGELPALLDEGRVDYLYFDGFVDGEHIHGESLDRELSMELLEAMLADFEEGTVGQRTVFDPQPHQYATISVDLRSGESVRSIDLPSSSVAVYDPVDGPVTTVERYRSFSMTITPEARRSWPLFLKLYDSHLAEKEVFP